MKQTNFENWETQDLELTFGLEQVWENTLLEEWLVAETEFSEDEKSRIEKLRNRILCYVDFWNEDELKIQSISRILDVVSLTVLQPIHSHNFTKIILMSHSFEKIQQD